MPGRVVWVLALWVVDQAWSGEESRAEARHLQGPPTESRCGVHLYRPPARTSYIGEEGHDVSCRYGSL